MLAREQRSCAAPSASRARGWNKDGSKAPIAFWRYAKITEGFGMVDVRAPRALLKRYRRTETPGPNSGRERPVAHRLLELLERAHFDLADTLAADAMLLAEIGKRCGFGA